MRLIILFQNRIKVIARLVLTLFFIIIIQLNIFSQVTEEWVARYNGPGNYYDSVNAIALDISGNVYVTGKSYGSGTDYDYATVKYNSSGAEQWVARYNGPGNSVDEANVITTDSSGNVYVTGESYDSGTSYDYATIKYNSSGVEQWVARYNGPGNYPSDYAYAIVLDISGNIYVTGESYGSGTSWDYATIKYDIAGIEQWVVRYNGPGNGYDSAGDIALDDSGNVYVTGLSESSVTSRDYATIKYNSSGSQQWVVRYNGPGNGYDEADDITLDNLGNVYVTGDSAGSGSWPDYYDYATIKYNSSGSQQWVARYNGTGNDTDYVYAMALDSSGNVYVTGDSDGSGTLSDYATIKYNSSGSQQWVARYNGTGNKSDWAEAIAIDSSGNVYVTGSIDGAGTSQDYATIKYNSSGVQQWVARYIGPGNDFDRATAIALDSWGNVYVSGNSYISGFYSDYATIKYSQGTSVRDWSLY